MRDISYDKNGVERPTNVLFSADTANPYELEPISGLISNLTCNPGIIYDLFINNPKANVGKKYKNRDEVMAEIGRILSLDSMRHSLRVLRNCNMKDTRLIVCSMEGPYNYPDIDKLLTEPEFIDMNKKVVITAEPNYLARFTSTNQVISYQRRFMNAAKGQS